MVFFAKDVVRIDLSARTANIGSYAATFASSQCQ